MRVPNRIARAAERRVAETRADIESALLLADRGVPLAAETNQERLISVLQRKTRLSRQQAAVVARSLALAREPASTLPKAGRRKATATRAARKLVPAPVAPAVIPGGAEKIWGDSIDFVSASFLERGALAARAVARIAFRDGRPQGTGFMISERLLITNNHVIASPAQASGFVAEFEYELGLDNVPLEPTRFALASDQFFVTDEKDDLDFTVIALGPRLNGRRELPYFGWCPLSGATDKHAIGDIANIVQHPEGRFKEVVLRENRLVSRLETVLHYVADTEPGSSGSPVFNNDWQAIALHHWGGPFRQRSDGGRNVPTEVNEGIRISAIVAELRARMQELPAAQHRLLDSALRQAESSRGPVSSNGPAAGRNGIHENGQSPRLNDDGTATWQVPIELSIRLPSVLHADSIPDARPATPGVAPLSTASEEKVKPSTDYSDRSGYKPGFLPGHGIPLPQLNDARKREAARIRQVEPGDDPYELKYHHFSIVMNKVRRLAFLTACNIDGTRLKRVDRSTGDVTRLELDDDGLRESVDGAEASDTWYADKRLQPGEYAGAQVYERQIVPGYPDPRDRQRTLRMFQRGHIVRRMDPAWGSDELALKADADTFHWTNCSPQVGFFNMGRADRNEPGTGGGKLWRAVENYVLRNALAEATRVTVFAGPIFRSSDRKFRGIQVPGEFWKIAVWVDDGRLNSVALIADQRPVIDVWPEGIEDIPEAFLDPDEISRVEDFVTSVADIEKRTGIDFGDQVRMADIHTGRERQEVASIEEAVRSGKRSTRSARKRSSNGLHEPSRRPKALAASTGRTNREVSSGSRRP